MDAERKQFLLTTLRDMLPKGSKVWTIHKGSGFSYMLLAVTTHGEPQIHDITRYANEIQGRKPNALYRMKGQGYNHARSAVEDLAHAIYDDTQALQWEGI